MAEISEVKGIIYKITCTPEGKCYIGQTLSHVISCGKWRESGISSRMYYHWISRNKRQTSIAQVMRKYSFSDFRIEVLKYCTGSKINELDKMETEAIIDNDTQHPNGYNTNRSGTCYSKSKRLLMEYYDLEPLPRYNTKKKRKSEQICCTRGIDKVKFFKEKDVTRIEIVPIRTKGKVLSRVLVSTSETTNRYRVMFQTLNGAIKFCKSISDVEPIIDKVFLGVEEEYKYKGKLDAFKEKTIQRICMRAFNYPYGVLYGIYVTTTETKHWKEKKKIVFGGRRCTGDDSYDLTLDFIERLKKASTTDFDINVCNRRSEKLETS